MAFLGVDHEGGLALGAFAFLAADFFAGLLAGGFFAQDLFGQFFAEVAAGEEAVHGLAAFAAAADFEARRDVAQDDGGGGFVDLLATVAAAADEAFVEVGFADAQLLHATEEGEFFFGGDGIEGHGGINMEFGAECKGIFAGAGGEWMEGSVWKSGRECQCFL